MDYDKTPEFTILEKIILWILMILLLVLSYFSFQAYSDCTKSGGLVVRGMFVYECIYLGKRR